MKEGGVFTPDSVATANLDFPTKAGRLNLPHIFKYLPKKFARYAAPTAMAMSAAVYGGAVCGEEESPDDGVLGVSSGQRFNPEAFLKVPMPRDPDAQVVQGWKYNVAIRGTRSHYAIDYVLGVDINDADTWNPFPVLAAAQGVGCVGHYTDSEHGEGNYVQLLHPNGYRTRYLHNEEGSLSDRPYPDCSRPSKEWLPLRQGDKLSEAGDAGTEEDWTHLHWEVFDQSGNKIDPYDLYTTRTEYPDPNFLNGKKCGSKTLIVNCPIDTSNAELAPTVEPVATLAPVPTLDPVFVDPISPPWRQPMSPPWEGDFNSPPNEFSDTTDGGGVISALGWEFRINSWGTEPDYDYGAVSVLHEGWKRVVVVGDLVNPSGSAKNTADIVRLFNTYDVYKFTVEGNGTDYEADLGRVEGYNSRSWKPMGMLNEVSVPGGLSIPFVIVAEVPNNVADYQLNLRDMRDGTHVAGPIGKGDIYSKAGGREDGAENGQKLEDCVVSGYARISYIGNVLYSASSMTTGNFQEQFLIFDVTNLSGRDIPVAYGRGGIEVSVFTADGGITEGSEYFYTEQYTRVMKIAPGLTREVGTVIGTDGADAIVANRLVDLDDATVSLTIWDGDRTPSNCKWKLP